MILVKIREKRRRNDHDDDDVEEGKIKMVSIIFLLG